jgi:hypothetical protein
MSQSGTLYDIELWTLGQHINVEDNKDGHHGW